MPQTLHGSTRPKDAIQQLSQQAGCRKLDIDLLDRLGASTITTSGMPQTLHGSIAQSRTLLRNKARHNFEVIVFALFALFTTTPPTREPPPQPLPPSYVSSIRKTVFRTPALATNRTMTIMYRWPGSDVNDGRDVTGAFLPID